MGASAQSYLIPSTLALNNDKLDYTADTSIPIHWQNTLTVHFGTFAQATQSGEAPTLEINHTQFQPHSISTTLKFIHAQLSTSLKFKRTQFPPRSISTAINFANRYINSENCNLPNQLSESMIPNC